jgi:uncharacterized phiE125 gp8 family phage protein
MSVITTSAPAVEPVYLSDLKDHLRIDSNDEDGLLMGYLAAARQMAEIETNRAFINQNKRLKMDSFSDSRYYRRGAIVVPFAPLSSVTSVKYLDLDEVEQTVSTDVYDVHADDAPGRITEADGENWPTHLVVRNAIRITYVAGYGATPDDVPQAIRQALMLTVGHWYEHRESAVEANSRSADDGKSIARQLHHY